MLAVSTSVGQSRYVGGEYDAVFHATSLPSRTAAIWCHGNNGTALTDYTAYSTELRMLAQRYTVSAADLGGNTFGNDTGIARVGQVVDYLESGWGTTGPVVLVAASMGVTVALNYAVRNPEKVAAVACIIPVLDLSAGGPAQAALDAAYPPAYNDTDPDHEAHNPLRFAEELPADLPIGLWVSTNDPAVPAISADAFVAARPQTYRNNFGAYGHGGINVAMPLVAKWLRGVA